MILVTGATGLVGSHLAYKLLLQGNDIKAVKRQSSDIQNTLKVLNYYTQNAQQLFNKITWVDTDLMDVVEVEELMQNVDEVYHCAAMVSFAPKDKNKLLKYNPEITANLVNASLKSRVKKFCMVSSVAVFDKPEEGFTTEENYWKNSPYASTYGLSKYLSEMEVWRGKEEGLNVVIVNPSLILGPGNWNGSSSVLFKTAHKGMPFYALGTNGFVDVRDVVNVMLQLMEKNIFGERFILNSENLPFKEFFTDLATAVGGKPPHIKAPKYLSEILWRVEWLRSILFSSQPVLTKETAHTAMRITEFSNQKITDTLSYKFIPVRESIKEIGAFYLEDAKNT